MECLNTTKNLKINKTKSIGEVVIVVEGQSEEFRLLKYIFTNVLDYNYVPLKRNKVMRDEFRSKTNINSTVIVANTSNSNIKSIMEDDNYQDKLYKLLNNDYKRSLKSVPIYLLWDRDIDSNDESIVIKTLNTFRNSLDNDNEMNGLLLLSYPCFESYEIANFDKQLYKKNFKSSKDAKIHFTTKRYSLSSINEQTLLNAVGNMHRTMLENNITKYDPSNFYNINKNLFDFEKKFYEKNKSFRALSLISIMLIDLGIIYDK